MKLTKKQRVYDYLTENKSITPLEAMNMFGCMRLGAVIYDLRHEGIDIITKDETGVDRFGNKTRYARYELKNENQV